MGGSYPFYNIQYCEEPQVLVPHTIGVRLQYLRFRQRLFTNPAEVAHTRQDYLKLIHTSIFILKIFSPAGLLLKLAHVLQLVILDLRTHPLSHRELDRDIGFLRRFFIHLVVVTNSRLHYQARSGLIG